MTPGLTCKTLDGLPASVSLIFYLSPWVPCSSQGSLLVALSKGSPWKLLGDCNVSGWAESCKSHGWIRRERASCCSVFCMHHLVRLSRGPIRPGATVPILQPRRPRLGRAKCLAQGHRQQVKGSLSVCDWRWLAKAMLSWFRQEHYCFISSGTWNPVGSPGPGCFSLRSLRPHLGPLLRKVTWLFIQVSSGSAIAKLPVRLETSSPGFQHHVAKGHVKVPALLILAS